MHLRQAECYIRLRAAAVLYQFVYSGGIVEVSKAFGHKFAFGFYAGVFVKIVISAKIIFIQQQVHLFATFAAKWFVVGFNNLVTLFTAVKAIDLYGGSCFYECWFVTVIKKYRLQKSGKFFFGQMMQIKNDMIEIIPLPLQGAIIFGVVTVNGKLTRRFPPAI